MECFSISLERREHAVILLAKAINEQWQQQAGDSFEIKTEHEAAHHRCAPVLRRECISDARVNVCFQEPSPESYDMVKGDVIRPVEPAN